MAAASPSSPSPAPASSAPPPSSSSRRVPPPCWSVEETLALIDSYQEKWQSLRRGNLRSHHWQEVAQSVSLRCPASPAKTSLQCRHKMEKLRKRHRSERARSLRSHPSAPPSSPWEFFHKMDSMEQHPPPRVLPHSTPPSLSPSPSLDSSSSSSAAADYPPSLPNGRPPRFQFPHPHPKAARSGRGPPVGGLGSRRVEGKRSRDDDDMGKIADALWSMCDGFVRMEQMKMDMASKMHKLRMEMELNRTKMMLDSQRRIVDTFLDEITSPSSATGTKRLRM